MRADRPIETLAECIGAALHRDLPDVVYKDRDWDKWRKLTKEQQIDAYKNPDKYDIHVVKTGRPNKWNIEVVMFPQTWGSTALGYGGMGGAAMTDAYTVIVSNNNDYCVYFGCDRLAYRVNPYKLTDESRNKFLEDIRNQNMPHCGETGYVQRKED
jgi:hypothetical protein